MLAEYPDLRASVNNVSAFQGGARPQIFQVNIGGPEIDQARASMPTDSRMNLKAMGGLTDLDTSLSLRKPEMQVGVDRERASDLGIPVGTVADTLRILVGGMVVSNFRDGGEQYDVSAPRQAVESRLGERAWSADDPLADRRPRPPLQPREADRRPTARPRSSDSAASGSSRSWRTPAR